MKKNQTMYRSDNELISNVEHRETPICVILWFAGVLAVVSAIASFLIDNW